MQPACCTRSWHTDMVLLQPDALQQVVKQYFHLHLQKHSLLVMTRTPGIKTVKLVQAKGLSWVSRMMATQTLHRQTLHLFQQANGKQSNYSVHNYSFVLRMVMMMTTRTKTMKMALAKKPRWSLRVMATQTCVCCVALEGACCAVMGAQQHTTCGALGKQPNPSRKGNGCVLNVLLEGEVWQCLLTSCCE